MGWDLNPNDKVVNAILKDVKPIMASVHATMTPKTNDVRAARIENHDVCHCNLYVKIEK